jgi:hypothetical protein
MVVKAWPLEPLIYAALVALLLIFRLVIYVSKHRRGPAAGTMSNQLRVRPS